jgi:hypothetical protein
MAGVAAPAAGAGAPPVEAGALSASKFLLVSREGLREGGALRRLGLIGGVLLLVAFVVPVLITPAAYDVDTGAVTAWDSVMSWDALDGGPKLALLYPLIAGLLGLALALVPRLPALARAGGLALLGVAGFALSLGQLGEPAGTPETLLTLTNLGIVAAGVGAAGRVLAPRSVWSRYAMIGGAAIAVIGYLVPMAKLHHALPIEFAMYDGALELDLTDASALGALTGGVDRRVPLLLFLALWGLVPIALLPGAAALAWRMPAEVWDKSSLGLRPLAWLAALYLPLGYALYLFNVTGWPDDGASPFLVARARLLLIATALGLWTLFGALAVCLDRFREADRTSTAA